MRNRRRHRSSVLTGPSESGPRQHDVNGGDVSHRWMPLMGEFDTTTEPLVFKGPARFQRRRSGQPQAAPAIELASVGILLSNLKMVNGRLRVTVKFNDVTPHSVCELIAGYDPHTKGQVTAGLGEAGPCSAFVSGFRLQPHRPRAAGPIISCRVTGPTLHAGVAMRIRSSHARVHRDS